MWEENIKIEKTVRLSYSQQPVPGSYDQLWFVLHGYGQLSTYFLRNFNGIAGNRRLIIAPEAPSRFYLKESAGRVGASWMTKEAREIDIEDYIAYLDQCLEHVFSKGIKAEKIVVLGFSQGAATASRWVNRSRHPLLNLVLWASVFPPDLAPDGHLFHKNVKSWLAYGDEDPYLTDMSATMQKIQDSGLKPHLYPFKGKHEIPPQVLSDFIEKFGF